MAATASVLLALLPAAAGAQLPEAKDGGPLSPPLAELASPALAAKPLAAQARQLGLPIDGPGSLLRDGGRVLVAARLSPAAAGPLAAVREAGARVLSADPQTRTATLSVAPSRLPDLAAAAGVRSVWQLRAPLVRTPEGQCEGGAAISEGLAQLQVDDARASFELRGLGQTVGVLSDSYDVAGGTATDAPGDVLSGDLPGPAGTCSDQQLAVDVLDEGPADSGDEGRAMLQIVHDLAPHADLAFATGFESEESFAENIERLARPTAEGGAGAGVIVDDVAWFEEPFFQDGPVAVAVANVVADGVSYLSAAGNDNLFDGSNGIASWEAPAFRDSGGCPDTVENLAGLKGTHCMDFDPGVGTDRTFGITVEANELLTVDLQWAEPWFGVGSDLDAFLLSEAGKLLAGSVEENSGASGTQRPVELVQWENTSTVEKTVRLAVNRFSGASPRLKFILLQNGGGVSATEYEQSSGGDVVGPAIYGHAGAASAIAVAATPFANAAKIERYSSRGPVTHYFGPVEGSAPAAVLGSPEVLAKPDLAATDCGATTFFASLSVGVWRFCGTSAAAPHAAAIAALVRQAKPTLPEQQVRSALTDTAVPVGAFGADAAGAGLVDAFAAIDGLPGPLEGGDGPSVQVPALETPPGPPGVPGTAVTPPGDAPPPAPPATRVLRHPPALVRIAGLSVRLAFRFGADQAGASFLCKVDRLAYRGCPSRFARRYGLGRHLLQVRARSAAGVLDPTPAAFRFRVAPRP
ncbi:MAG TPA: S8 family serine peptidase [Solirubrobacterales bacterium]|nr:S8 family serine peptidase [Solirubrobacterales bacterium]